MAAESNVTKQWTHVVVDNSALARDIGARLREARHAAGLTQSELAAGRYTKAYISALENGLSKPSMAALTFLAGRLGLPVSRFIGDETSAWTRLEADLALAASRWSDALDMYRSLLETAASPSERAELLAGMAEALCGLDQATEAAAVAGEAASLFASLAREAEAAIATYWLSCSLHQRGNTVEARSLLEAILSKVRAGLRVEPDFEFRILAALASNASRDGQHALAISYLEEVRSIAGRLDDRRRAAYYANLAQAYRESHDFEGAIRAGLQALPLFRATHLDFETAALENDLALSYLSVGNTAKAWELATGSAAVFERLEDRRWMSHVLETQAQIKLGEGDAATSATLAEHALALAEETANEKAALSALLSLGRALRQEGRADETLSAFERAADLARAEGKPVRIRLALGELADALVAAGEQGRALEIMREALRAE